MLPAPGSVRLVALSAVLVALLSSCTGSADPSAGPSGSPSAASPGSPASTPATSPSPSPSAPDAPAPPKGRRGPEGQRAFARFVMQAWSWSLITNDATPLLQASPSRKQLCDGCRRLQEELEDRAKEGWYVDFPGLTVERTRLTRNGRTVTATTKVAIPESDSFFEDGTYRSSSPAHPDASFVVRMRLADDGYQLLAFSVS